MCNRTRQAIEIDMTFDELKKFLMEAEYTDSQFKELKAITEIQLGNFSAQQEPAKEKEMLPVYTEAFYNQLRQYLEMKCHINTPPIRILKGRQPKVYANVVKCANALYVVAEDWNTARTMRRAYVTAVYHLYIKLAIQYLKDSKVPVSATTLVQHSDKFVGLADQAYPGYVDGGMMNVILLGRKAI